MELMVGTLWSHPRGMPSTSWLRDTAKTAWGIADVAGTLKIGALKQRIEG